MTATLTRLLTKLNTLPLIFNNNKPPLSGGFTFKNMPKNYPSFIIDRSKRSDQSNHTDDFIVCVDKEVGFIARAYKLNRTQFEAYNKHIDTMSQDDVDCTYAVKNFGDIAAVIEVIELLHPPLVNKPRIKSLLKKAARAYLIGEGSSIGVSDIDKQIKAVNDVEQLLTPQRDTLAELNGAAAADGILNGLTEAVKSLGMLKMLYNGKDKA